jgi:hypothetical protein
MKTARLIILVALVFGLFLGPANVYSYHFDHFGYNMGNSWGDVIAGWSADSYTYHVDGDGHEEMGNFRIVSDYGNTGPVPVTMRRWADGEAWITVSDALKAKGILSGGYASVGFNLSDGDFPGSFNFSVSAPTSEGVNYDSMNIDETLEITLNIGEPYWAFLRTGFTVNGGMNPGDPSEWILASIRANWGGFSLTLPPEPVPEPTTILLLASGLIGLAGYGRKKFFKK